MRIVVTFDTPYEGWEHPDHERQMATEVAAWKHAEPEMEYQIADALDNLPIQEKLFDERRTKQ